MTEDLPERTRDGALLSAALKMIRRHRGMTAAEVAAGMQLAVRTYERFEAGETRRNTDYIHRFAVATDSDPYAIHLAIAIGEPELALHCIDNHLATILVVGAKRFNRRMRGRLTRLDTRTIISAVTAMFDGLADQALADHAAQQWLEAGVDELNSSRPKPGR